ncbi:hypothetical protein C1752_03914 [Acaryochloris thomasi RCC1774]|uniref:Uncharacterized protein n=1 Tax=Acaryochloris thomasi RCC1774 TaxID=1764569 RepID=A0A2W1JUX6_9CYAN|nr:hypothetical protein C1752_03914 [Acaryochloris thomasi RCC1774]
MALWFRWKRMGMLGRVVMSAGRFSVSTRDIAIFVDMPGVY